MHSVRSREDRTEFSEKSLRHASQLKESHHENHFLSGTAGWSYAGRAKRMGRCRNTQSGEPAGSHGHCGSGRFSVARWTDRRLSMSSVRSHEDRTESRATAQPPPVHTNLMQFDPTLYLGL